MKLLVLSLLCGFAAGFCVTASAVIGQCDPDLTNEHVDRSVDCELTQAENPLENFDRGHNLDDTAQALMCNVFLLMVNVASMDIVNGDDCRFVNPGNS